MAEINKHDINDEKFIKLHILSRYNVSLSNEFYRAYNELLKVQNIRKSR